MEPLNNREIQDGFPHPDPLIPVRPERSEAKSKDALSHREREFKPELVRGS